MKSLKIVLVAVSLCAAVAHAQQTPAPAADAAAKQTAKAEVSGSEGRVERRSVAPDDTRKGEECVGPISYCTMYFGS